MLLVTLVMYYLVMDESLKVFNLSKFAWGEGEDIIFRNIGMVIMDLHTADVIKNYGNKIGAILTRMG